MPPPVVVLRFVGRHADLLLDIFRRGKGIPALELLATIARHSEGVNPSTLRDQLLDMGVIEPLPHEDLTYDLSVHVEQLLGTLERRQRLTSPEVLRAYVRNIEERTAELRQAARSHSRGDTVRVLQELEGEMKRLRFDSQVNRQAITSEVGRLKLLEGFGSDVARFETVNRLWHQYLVRLRELIEPEGTMDVALDALEGVLVDVGETFITEGVVAEEAVRVSRRISATRRSVADDHEEAVAEVQPLYERLRQSTAPVRGASSALEHLLREGPSALTARCDLRFVKRPRRALIKDAAWAAFLLGIRGYTPSAPEPIPEADVDNLPPIITAQELASRLYGAVPLNDVLAWLANEFPTASLRQILHAYAWVFAGRFGEPELAADRERVVRIGNWFIEGTPVRLLSVEQS